MAKEFKKATKEQSFLRMALVGPSGAGKTFSALSIAQGLGKRIALVDSERKSASKYATEFDFDTVQLETDFSPKEYIEAIEAAVAGGYDVLIIDSLSHAWNDHGGILEMKDAIAAQNNMGSDFMAWRKVTPEHNKLVDTILRAPLHVIVTLRAKMEYLVDKDERGKTQIHRVGLKPIQRDGLEYEFDVVGDLDQSNTLTITKTRCRALFQASITQPNGDNPGKILTQWLTDGAPPVVSHEQLKELAAAAKAKGLSVGGLLDLINQTLGVQYTSPREVNVEEFSRVMKAVTKANAPATETGDDADAPPESDSEAS